jgi:predicted RNase H-like HicB family nuclease
MVGWSNALMMSLETDREVDGRWIAEVPDLRGVMAYGATREEAIAKVQSLALRVLADRIDHGETIPEVAGNFLVTP